eukprot:scaffold3763_cov165-Amphora_coffeaeformis.AAC.11
MALPSTASNATEVGATTATAIPTIYESSPSPKKKKKKNTWFPTRIQETVPYRDIVQRLYLRHIVTETKGLADWVVQQTTALSNSDKYVDGDDTFAALARNISACSTTRDEGGKLGWVEGTTDSDNNLLLAGILPADVITAIYDRQPKAGDMMVILSSSTNQWHCIQVMEAWMHPPMDGSSSRVYSPSDRGENDEEFVVGAHQGINSLVKRPKLKGAGVLPTLPSHMTTYTIQTSGCQMNVADSERLEGVLQDQLHLTRAAKPAEADLVLLNTCSIRDHAEQKLYDTLGPYAARKRKGEQIALIVTGCVAQQEGEALLRRVPEIDVVLGPQYVPYLANVLDRVQDGHQVVATAPMLVQEDMSQPIRGHDVRAWVNVIYGCNEHCTYCVVPATRGMEQSRTMEAILKECLDLAANGYKEVTLLGQNIDAYGRDMVPKRNFADLLEFLNARLPSPMRIRYVTSHPRYFSDRVIDAVANLDKVCECFHMPFQAGDDQVLRNMRRGYTYDSYMRIIRKIRERAPDSAICGDVIVGFPGETEESFQKTLQLMEEVKFDNLNTFAYSPRPNTEAALWEDQVSDDVKADRLQRVQQLATKHGLERSQRYLNRIVEVLVEDSNPRNPTQQVMGRTRQGRQVYFDGNLSELKGEFVRVKITEARTWSLAGELASE